MLIFCVPSGQASDTRGSDTADIPSFVAKLEQPRPDRASARVGVAGLHLGRELTRVSCAFRQRQRRDDLGIVEALADEAEDTVERRFLVVVEVEIGHGKPPRKLPRPPAARAPGGAESGFDVRSQPFLVFLRQAAFKIDFRAVR
jgi:hypothetical protein